MHAEAVCGPSLRSAILQVAHAGSRYCCNICNQHKSCPPTHALSGWGYSSPPWACVHLARIPHRLDCTPYSLTLSTVHTSCAFVPSTAQDNDKKQSVYYRDQAEIHRACFILHAYCIVSTIYFSFFLPALLLLQVVSLLYRTSRGPVGGGAFGAYVASGLAALARWCSRFGFSESYRKFSLSNAEKVDIVSKC